jgi:hypothetical protein
MDLGLKGKTAIVTGGASNIGRVFLLFWARRERMSLSRTSMKNSRQKPQPILKPPEGKR